LSLIINDSECKLIIQGQTIITTRNMRICFTFATCCKWNRNTCSI